MKKWRKNHPEQAKESSRISWAKWRKNHPEQAKERSRVACEKWRKNHPEQAKESNRVSCAKWRKNHPEQAKESDRRQRLKKKYGLTLEDYEELRTKQNECCACCGKHESVLTRGLHVDHCHETGKIRGLLCHLCNTAIGKLGDNVEGLTRALIYLTSQEKTE